MGIHIEESLIKIKIIHADYAGSRVEYIQLALKYKPLNLGQGFPDYYAPENVTNALAAIAKSNNPLLQQYTRGFVSFVINLIYSALSLSSMLSILYWI